MPENIQMKWYKQKDTLLAHIWNNTNGKHILLANIWSKTQQIAHADI